MISKTLVVLVIAVALASIPIVSADGYITFRIRGGSVQDPYIFIVRNVSDIQNFSYTPDHSDFDGIMENPDATVIKVMPNGESDLIHMWDGNYISYIRQGNSDQPEVRPFVVGGHGFTYVSFLGAAIPTDSMGCCSCRNVTVIDVPGTVIHHPEINHTEKRGSAVISYKTVVDSPAWDEIIHHPELNHTVCDETKIIIQKQITRNGIIIMPWVTAKCSSYHGRPEDVCIERIVNPEVCDTVIDAPGYDEIIHHAEVSHVETITHAEEWDDVVVDVPAWDEQIGAITHEERKCNQEEVCPCGCTRGSV